METRTAQLRFDTEFENSDRFSVDVLRNYELLVDPFTIASDVTIPAGAYDFQDIYVAYAMGAQRRVSGTLSFQRGEFFDGNITAVGYSRGRIEVTPQLSIEPSISINRVVLPQGRFTAKLVTSRVTYTFTPRMFVSGLVQYEKPDPGFLSAHSSSVKNSFPSRSAGRSIGVVVEFVHIPCRSGAPHGVRSPLSVPAVWVWPTTSAGTSNTTVMTVNNAKRRPFICTSPFAHRWAFMYTHDRRRRTHVQTHP